MGLPHALALSRADLTPDSTQPSSLATPATAGAGGEPPYLGSFQGAARSGGGSTELLLGAAIPRFGSGGGRRDLGPDKPRVCEGDEGAEPSIVDAAEDADRTFGLVVPENADLKLV